MVGGGRTRASRFAPWPWHPRRREGGEAGGEGGEGGGAAGVAGARGRGVDVVGDAEGEELGGDAAGGFAGALAGGDGAEVVADGEVGLVGGVAVQEGVEGADGRGAGQVGEELRLAGEGFAEVVEEGLDAGGLEPGEEVGEGEVVVEGEFVEGKVGVEVVVEEVVRGVRRGGLRIWDLGLRIGIEG